MRPTQAPLAFSITENMLKPLKAQAPATDAMPRQAAARDWVPPM